MSIERNNVFILLKLHIWLSEKNIGNPTFEAEILEKVEGKSEEQINRSVCVCVW